MFFILSQAWHKENVSCIITARISNIVNPSSIQDKCCIWIYTTSQWALLTVESLWLSGRASDCEIRRSEVWFLKGTQNFSFVLHSWQVKKTFFSQYTPGIKIYIQTNLEKQVLKGREDCGLSWQARDTSSSSTCSRELWQCKKALIAFVNIKLF